MSPFVVTVGHHKDVKHYQTEEAIRRISKSEMWPALVRAYVHFENGNLDLMKKECVLVTKNMHDLKDWEERGGWILSVTRHFFDRFVAYPDRYARIEKSVALALRKSESELRALATEYVKTGRMRALWKEQQSVRTQFIELYESLLPILMVQRYWKDHLRDVDDYILSNKNFEDLSKFYVDTVETSFKLLVIGLGVELIAKIGKPTISTKSGDKDIWWFEQLSNGIKDGQLKNHQVFDQITSALDLRLRNGVGHNSAHYDTNSDEVIYVKADGAKMQSIRLPYTQFVRKVFDAYCAFELLSVFYQWFFVAGGGKLV